MPVTADKSGNQFTLGDHANHHNELARLLNSLETPPAWTAVTFQNGWVNIGGGFAPASFRKHANGLVEVKGLIRGTTINTVAFTLPVGLRPTEIRIYPADTNAGHGRLDVRPNGDVLPTAGGLGHHSIESITFFAEQ